MSENDGKWVLFYSFDDLLFPGRFKKKHALQSREEDMSCL